MWLILFYSTFSRIIHMLIFGLLFQIDFIIKNYVSNFTNRFTIGSLAKRSKKISIISADIYLFANVSSEFIGIAFEAFYLLLFLMDSRVLKVLFYCWFCIIFSMCKLLRRFSPKNYKACINCSGKLLE